MDSILIFPENANQFSAVKAFLEEMKIKFSLEKSKNIVELTDFEKKLVDQGFENIEKGETKTKEEAHQIFMQCFK